MNNSAPKKSAAEMSEALESVVKIIKESADLVLARNRRKVPVKIKPFPNADEPEFYMVVDLCGNKLSEKRLTEAEAIMARAFISAYEQDALSEHHKHYDSVKSAIALLKGLHYGIKTPRGQKVC